MKRFSDQFPDISRPDSTPRSNFRAPTDDQWDFYLASVFGDVPTLSQIHSRDPGIHATFFYDFPLLMAVRQGRVEAVRYLLNSTGGRIDDALPKDTVWFARCIDTAKARGFDEIHELLVEQKAKGMEFAPPDTAKLDETLRKAVSVGDVAETASIIKANPQRVRVSRFQQAEILSLAYDAKVDVEQRIELLHLLFRHGVDPNSEPLIHRAAEANDLLMAQFLLEQGADPNSIVDSCGDCLWIVRFRNPHDYQDMQALLRSFGGRMPLGNEFEEPSYEELLSGDRETLEMLNDSGELLSGLIHHDDVALLDRYVEFMGNDRITLVSPNRGAYVPTSTTMLDRLVEHGMNINQRDWRGETMLFANDSVAWATRCFHHGADLNTVEFVDSATRLGWAAKDNQPELAEFLLEHGADPSLPTEHAWAQPLAIARERNHARIIRLLESVGP